MDSSSMREFLRKEVPDWDDEVTATARFKAFSGQRFDWEPKFQFWRDLILRISRHFGFFMIRPSQVKNEWFNRGGLAPLCLDDVLLVMYNEGNLMRIEDLPDPSSGRLTQLFRKVKILMTRSRMTPEAILEDQLILTALLKEKAEEVVKLLSERHWTSSCIVTMKKLESMCGGPVEASAVLSDLSGCGKAQYLSTSKKELIEGVKVSLTAAAVSSISSLDCDVLHLIWTQEKLQQQLNVIDQRWEMSRKSALASLKSGNKKVALRHAREIKLSNESREKCSLLLNRVEEVLRVIADAESTKKVSEAIQIGAQAMKENKISVEEVQNCLEELDESIESQKLAEKALESAPYLGIDDEDIEEEFQKLELEVGRENVQDLSPETSNNNAAESADLLSDALSSLKLDTPHIDSTSQDSTAPVRKKDSKNLILEAA
ncbi:hypothetical protein SLEP1_g33077 [Rubroshorea leprosula]|uniref:Charged multivesicular body protein 7 n=1 Tax=Rubroshorea leprosula TaxID=152421 RepID=A0AAV5KFK5_9ROSI|nr:hypothetical protein SLEP1_g33077 [Rubroshorea leprosula]